MVEVCVVFDSVGVKACQGVGRLVQPKVLAAKRGLLVQLVSNRLRWTTINHQEAGRSGVWVLGYRMVGMKCRERIGRIYCEANIGSSNFVLFMEQSSVSQVCSVKGMKTELSNAASH